MPAEAVGISSTMFSVRRLCNRMSFHSIYLSMSILPRPCLPHFDIIRCIYTTSASFIMSCLVEGVSVVLHLRSVPILPEERGYVQKLLCWSRGMDEQVTKKSGIYIKTESFFSRHHIIVLRWRVVYVFTAAV
jgi:hypothetical protein